MREIKFRAWDCKEMHYPGGYYTTTKQLELRPHFSGKIGSEIMQYTGLKDKNGKEIYEGDIIKSPLGNIVEVFFGKKTYQFGLDRIEANGWVVRNKRGSTETLDDSFLEGEVIGNIHQNPELINS